MKKYKLKLLSLLSIIFLIGCVDNNKGYPKYEYAIDSYCPDSNQSKRKEWIKEVVRASNQHLSAGDYENPEDVIRQVDYTSEGLFRVRGEGLVFIKFKNEYKPEFIPKERMTDFELNLFNKLRKLNSEKLNEK